MRVLAAEVSTALATLDPPAAVRRAGDTVAALCRMLPRLEAEPAADLAALPFLSDPTLPAGMTGIILAAWHRRLARTGRPSLPALLAAAFDAIGLGPDAPERRLAMLGAVLAHATPAPRFHNARHTREVVADAIWLAAATSALPTADHALLLLAATIHDLGHDGGTNTRADPFGQVRTIPCLLEDRAVALILPAAARAGLAPARQADLIAIVRATDIALRPALTALHDAPGLPPSLLSRLAARPRALRVAALLADADVLASAGLTEASLRTQTARLGAERGRWLAPAETLGFFDHLLGGRFISSAGRRLDSNLQALRARIAAAR